MALDATNASTLQEDLTPHGSGCHKHLHRHTVFLASPDPLFPYLTRGTGASRSRELWGIDDPAAVLFFCLSRWSSAHARIEHNLKQLSFSLDANRIICKSPLKKVVMDKEALQQL